MSGNGENGATRLTAKGRANRDQIVAAAAELMFGHGVARTRVEDVQKKAAVSYIHTFAARRGDTVAVAGAATSAKRSRPSRRHHPSTAAQADERGSAWP